MSFKIGIDLDGTVFDTMPLFKAMEQDWLKLNHKKTLVEEDVQEYLDWVGENYTNLPMHEEAQSALLKIHEHFPEIEFYVITSRKNSEKCKNVILNSQKALKSAGIPIKKFIYGVPSKQKYRPILKYRLNVFIEDTPIAIKEASNRTKAYVLTCNLDNPNCWQDICKNIIYYYEYCKLNDNISDKYVKLMNNSK